LWLPPAHGETPGAIRHAGAWWKLVGPNRQLWVLLGLSYQVMWRSSNRVGAATVPTKVVVAMVIVVLLVVLVVLVIVVVIVILMVATAAAPSATAATPFAAFGNFLVVEVLIKLHTAQSICY